MERFRRGEDPYLPMASRYHGRGIVKGDPERQDGKTIELACGFGMGGDKLAARAKSQGVTLDGKRGVDAYRETHQQVVKLWKQGDWALQQLAGRYRSTWGILDIEDGRIHHPNGSWLDYSTLKWVGEWRLRGRRGWSKMYGAKLVENVVQWLSRIVTVEAMARFEDVGYSVVGMAHDDVWLLVPVNDYRKYDPALTDENCAEIAETETANHKLNIIDIMRQTPSWAPGLPLDADCKIGETYS